MTLLEQLQSDLKDAMRAGDVLRRETLRMAMAGLKNRRIEKGSDLDEGEEMTVLTKAVKMRKEAIEQFTAAGRTELAEKEAAEAVVLQSYLPAELSEDEVAELVKAKLAELEITSKRDLGKLMKALMAEHKGRIDGKVVQRIAGQLLT